MYGWEENEQTSYFSDADGSMWYRFSPAANNPQSAPFFIILHGHGNFPPTKFSHPNWNVLNPLDNFGLNGNGSWWKGEGNNSQTQHLFDKILNEALGRVGQELATAIICMYGSSMGGYGCILHGARIGAKGVYANVPQIKLLGSTYSEKGMKRYFREVFNEDSIPIENDLSLYVERIQTTHPLYFICENRFGQENYLAEQCMSFVNSLDNLGLNYHLEIIPTSGHKKNRGINYVRKLFEQYVLPDKED